MDLQQLTKKNQEFVHIATKQLIQDGKTDGEIKAILEEVLPIILDNQKKGFTARTLLGAPTVWAASFTESSEDKAAKPAEKNTNPWLMWLDTSLLFIGIVALLNGVLSFFNTGTATASGLASLLALGFGGGAAMYATYHFIYRHMGKDKSERPGWIKTILALTIAMILWIFLYTVTAFLPTILNPQLPAAAMIVIGAVALAVRYYLKKKYNILNALSPQQ